MVDAIKHNVRQMVAPAPQDAKSAPSRSAVASMGAVPDAQIAAEDSQVSVKASVSSLAQTPPINMEAVSRIKQAIADGEISDQSRFGIRAPDGKLHRDERVMGNKLSKRAA